jgi:proteasome component ECM29
VTADGVAIHGQPGFWTAFREVLRLLVGLLSHQQPLLASAACLAVGEMGRCGPLAETGGGQDELRDKLVAELLRLLKSEKVSMKIRERAAMSRGLVCVGDPDFPDRKKIVQSFIDAAHDIKVSDDFRQNGFLNYIGEKIFLFKNAPRY